MINILLKGKKELYYLNKKLKEMSEKEKINFQDLSSNLKSFYV